MKMLYNQKENGLPLLLDRVAQWQMNDVACSRLRRQYETARNWAEQKKKRRSELKATEMAKQLQFRTTSKRREKREAAVYVNSSQAAKDTAEKVMEKLK